MVFHKSIHKFYKTGPFGNMTTLTLHIHVLGSFGKTLKRLVGWVNLHISIYKMPTSWVKLSYFQNLPYPSSIYGIKNATTYRSSVKGRNNGSNIFMAKIEIWVEPLEMCWWIHWFEINFTVISICFSPYMHFGRKWRMMMYWIIEY